MMSSRRPVGVELYKPHGRLVKPWKNTHGIGMASGHLLPDGALEIITADEVAQLLGVDRKTIYAAARRNEIPHRRLG